MLTKIPFITKVSNYLKKYVDIIKIIWFTDNKNIKEEQMNDSVSQDTNEKANSMYISPTKFLQSAIKNGVVDISAELEMLSIIPGWSNPESNALSKIYHTFKGISGKRQTDIPVGLPIFSYMVFLASALVKNDVKYIKPSMNDGTAKALNQSNKTPDNLNMWLLLLADSGDAKTFTIDVIKKASQIEEDFSEVQSALALAQNLSDNEKGLWINDEFGQLWEIMQGSKSDGMEWRKVFLQGKDGKVEWKSKATQIEKKTDLAVSALLVNTEHQLNKATSDDSLKDGMVRRMNVAYVVEKELKDNYDFLTFDKDYLISEIKPLIEKSLERVEQLKDSVFTFDAGCYQQSQNVYQLAGKMYAGYLEKPFIKTYLNEAYKFAIYMHVITDQPGTVIQPDTMEKGLAVSLLLLDSFKKFLMRRSSFERKSSNENNRNLLKAEPKRIFPKTNNPVSLTALQIKRLQEKEAKKGKDLVRRDIQRSFPRLSKEEIDTLFNVYMSTKKPPEAEVDNDFEIPF